MTPLSRKIFLAASLILVSTYFLPLWKISLDAPQYPEGIGMYIWLDSITGVNPHDLANINGLNHYIGMKKIEPESYIPWIRSANCYAKSGDYSMALKNLKSAVQKGFSNRLYIEKNFTSLSSEKGYQKLLEDLDE